MPRNRCLPSYNSKYSDKPFGWNQEPECLAGLVVRSALELLISLPVIIQLDTTTQRTRAPSQGLDVYHRAGMKGTILLPLQSCRMPVPTYNYYSHYNNRVSGAELKQSYQSTSTNRLDLYSQVVELKQFT